MAGKNLVVISLKIPRDLLEDVDKVVKSGRYRSRSDLIRRAIRRELLRGRLGAGSG